MIKILIRNYLKLMKIWEVLGFYGYDYEIENNLWVRFIDLSFMA